MFAERDFSLGDGDSRMRKYRITERRFTATVGPHQDTRRALRHDQVDTVQNSLARPAVGGARKADVEVFDSEC